MLNQLLVPIHFLYVLLLGTLLFPLTSLAQKTSETGKSASETGKASSETGKVSNTATKVTVYYFHGSRRCKTCLSVESVSKGVVDDTYGNKNVVFLSVDIDEEKNEKLAERFEVAGSALLVHSATNTEDLTTQAFQYARSKPEKLRSALVRAIDSCRK